MKQRTIWKVYFSATGTTEKIVSRIADQLAALTADSGAQGEAEEGGGTPGGEDGGGRRVGEKPQTWALKQLDFTLPQARENPAVFSPGDLVVVGTPVYAGRVPNVLLSYLNTWQGNGATAVPVAVYGNRNYDDALIELRDILEKDGFHTLAAAAFIGEHSFSKILAAGRPDEEDLAVADQFAQKLSEKLLAGKPSGEETLTGRDPKKEPDGAPGRESEKKQEQTPVPVRGQSPLRPYYQPRDRKGNFINILKVKPKTREEDCVQCGLCASVCPMGSISSADVSRVDGICIKCGSCVKKCPTGAKYYDDEGYLYHKTELELGYVRRAQPELFLGETLDDYN